MTRVKTRLCAGTVLAGALLGGAAYAQPAPQNPAQQSAQSALGPTAQTPGAPVSPTAADTVQARQGSNSGAEAPSGFSTLSEVVITAEKREQSLQQVPVAVSAFTGEKRDLIGIQSIVDQTNYTPGLTYSAENDRISIRGVGRLTNNRGADGGSAQYVDGAFTTSTVELGRSPLFVERTEVLRGPQGTLYGRNAIGGALNVISKRPTKEFAGEGRVTVANYDRQEYEFAVSGPITDWLRYRAGYSRIFQRDGFNTNLSGLPDENGVQNQQYYEAQLEGEIGKFDFWYKYASGRWRNSAGPGQITGGSFAPPETQLFGTGSAIIPLAQFAFTGGVNASVLGPIRGNPVLVTGDLRSFQTDTTFFNRLSHNSINTLHGTYHFDAFDVKYIGSHQRYDYYLQTDLDGTSVQSYQVPLSPTSICRVAPTVCQQATVVPVTVGEYNEDIEWYSHEVNLVSTWDSPFQYVLGLYNYHEKASNPQNGYAPGINQVATPLGGPANPSRSYNRTSNYIDIDSRAVFGQVDWKFIENFKVTVGARYTVDRKKVTEEFRRICYGLPACTAAVAPFFASVPGLTAANFTLQNFGTLVPAVDITSTGTGNLTATQIANGLVQEGVVGPSVIDPVTGLARRRLRSEWDAFTGTAGLEWTPDRRTLVYGRYSRGYKAGGFNAASGGQLNPFPYTDKEEIDAFELGLKKDWTRRFQTNISAFYNLYHDAQVPVTVQQAVGPAIGLFFNIPESTIKGVELESIWNPIDRLNILFTYGYLDAGIDKACCVSDPNDPTATQPGAKPAAASGQGAVDPITGLPARGQDLSGNQLPLSPKHKIAANANYTVDLNKYGVLIGSFSYLYRSEQFSSIFSREYNRIPGRDQIDLRVTYKEPGNRFTVIGYAQNVTNEDDFNSVGATRQSTGQLFQTFNLINPRTYGIQVQAKF